MIQGGDPLTKDESKQAQWGTGGPGYKVDAEFNDTAAHARRAFDGAFTATRIRPAASFSSAMATRRFLDKQYTAFGKAHQRRRRARKNRDHRDSAW